MSTPAGANITEGVVLDALRGVKDPDLGRSEEHTSELQSLRHLVCRLLLEKKNKQDDSSRSGWLCLGEAKGEPLKATSYRACGFYVAKYVTKQSEMDVAAKRIGDKDCNHSL